MSQPLKRVEDWWTLSNLRRSRDCTDSVQWLAILNRPSKILELKKGALHDKAKNIFIVQDCLFIVSFWLNLEDAVDEGNNTRQKTTLIKCDTTKC